MAMNKNEYEKVFQHITDLAQKNALGKISHEAMHEGLKKLLTEFIDQTGAHAVKTEKRKAFWGGWLTGAGLMAALACLAFILWRKGILAAWMKAHGF